MGNENTANYFANNSINDSNSKIYNEMRQLNDCQEFNGNLGMTLIL